MNIRTLCLGILTLGDATGYEIKKMVEGPFSHFYRASFGSIYPALSRLTEEGFVLCTATAQERRPPKKVYRIGPDGRLAFVDDLMAPIEADAMRSDFLMMMFFSHLLPAQHLARVLDRRLAEYREGAARLLGTVSDAPTAGQRFVCGFGVAVYGAAGDFLEENRHLVEGEAMLGAGGRIRPVTVATGAPVTGASEP